jgi:hypothetical protein
MVSGEERYFAVASFCRTDASKVSGNLIAAQKGDAAF